LRRWKADGAPLGLRKIEEIGADEWAGDARDMAIDAASLGAKISGRIAVSPRARGRGADADTLYRPCEAITHPIIPTGLALYELLQPAA